MYVIEKIKIEDPEQFAQKIADQMPSIDPIPDSWGDFYETKDIDITVGEIVVFGTLTLSGHHRVVLPGDYFSETEYETYELKEVDDLAFYINGEPVEVDNEQEIVTMINEKIFDS